MKTATLDITNCGSSEKKVIRPIEPNEEYVDCSYRVQKDGIPKQGRLESQIIICRW